MDSAQAGAGGMTQAEALDWLAELFEEPTGRLQPDSGRGDIAAWDSLGQLVLMSALDQRLGIRLTQAELASMATIADVLDVLARNRCLRGA